MIRAGLQWFLFKNGVCASNHFESGGFVKSDPSVSHPDIQMQFVPTAMKEAGSSEIIQHGYQVKLSTKSCFENERVGNQRKNEWI